MLFATFFFNSRMYFVQIYLNLLEGRIMQVAVKIYE